MKWYIVQWERPPRKDEAGLQVERAQYQADTKGEVTRGAKAIARINGWKFVGVSKAIHQPQAKPNT